MARLGALTLCGVFVLLALVAAVHGLDVPRQHVVVISIPLNGHYFPIKAVAEELLRRGHVVTVLTESSSWCKTAAGSPTIQCVELAPSNTFQPALLERVSAMPVLADSFTVIFEEMVAHHNATLARYIAAMNELMKQPLPPTVVFGDASTFVSFSVAAKFNLPRIQMFPLVLRLTIGPAAWLPGLGQGLPREMTTAMRLNTAILDMLTSVVVTLYLLPTLNAQRAAFGIRPFKNMVELAGGYDITLAPTIWPYDIPQPLCPNVRPLGTLVPDHGVEPLESDLRDFLDSCSASGAIYVNFGTLSVLSERLRAELQDVFFAPDFAPCVVWKPNKKHLDEVSLRVAHSEEAANGKRRIFVSMYFNNAFEIMKHPSVKAFITHCGDTSFGEAVEAGLPLIGIPFFADQSDVCQRMQETEVGVYVGHKDAVTAADVRRAVDQVFAEGPVMREKLAKLRGMARYLGGASVGADFVEAQGAFRAGDLLSCADLDPVVLGSTDAETGEILTSWWVQLRVAARVGQWDVMFFSKVLPCLFLSYWAVRLLRRLLRLVFGGKKAVAVKAKTE